MFSMLLSWEENEAVSAMEKVLTKEEFSSLMWSIPAMAAHYEASMPKGEILQEWAKEKGIKLKELKIKDLKSFMPKGYIIPEGWKIVIPKKEG